MVWHLRVVDGPYQSVEVEKKSHLTSDKAIERVTQAVAKALLLRHCNRDIVALSR